MVVYQDFSGRVKELRAHFDMNQAEFAVFMKTHGSTISDFESGNRTPSKEFIIRLSEIGVSTDWFLTGKGPMLKAENRLNGEKIIYEKDGNPSSAPFPDTSAKGTIETKHRGIPLVFEGDKEFEDGIVIPVLGDNPVSAGLGENIGDGELPTRYIHAPKELAKYPHLMSLPVRGDSMTPTLSDGDMVVCDGGGWDGDGIYVIKTIDETFVKRVQHTPQGYRIVSDNKLYESYTGSAEEIAIVGRVRAMVVMVPGRRGGV